MHGQEARGDKGGTEVGVNDPLEVLHCGLGNGLKLTYTHIVDYYIEVAPLF